MLSLSPGIPTDYKQVTIIKDRTYDDGRPELKNIPLFFSAEECIEWMSALLDGHFSLIGNQDYRPTTMKWGKQRIYQRIEDGNYWYFDFYHRENKIHYEVFDVAGSHLGEANAEGALVVGTADAKKSISKILHGK